MTAWTDYYNSPALQKHSKLLHKLSYDDRVFDVGYYPEDKTYSIIECCDDYFYHDLTKADCLELSELFKDIADEMEGSDATA